MRSSLATRAVAVGVVAGLGIAAAGPAFAADPGVTSKQVVIGMTTPLTGPASPGYKDVAPAAQAYFDYVNANGGINGRKVELKVYDDAYTPCRRSTVTVNRSQRQPLRRS